MNERINDPLSPKNNLFLKFRIEKNIKEIIKLIEKRSMLFCKNRIQVKIIIDIEEACKLLPSYILNALINTIMQNIEKNEENFEIS